MERRYPELLEDYIYFLQFENCELREKVTNLKKVCEILTEKNMALLGETMNVQMSRQRLLLTSPPHVADRERLQSSLDKTSFQEIKDTYPEFFQHENQN
jgi:hypothetical protein